MHTDVILLCGNTTLTAVWVFLISRYTEITPGRRSPPQPFPATQQGVSPHALTFRAELENRYVLCSYIHYSVLCHVHVRHYAFSRVVHGFRRRAR